MGDHRTTHAHSVFKDCGVTIVMKYVGAVCKLKQSKRITAAIKPGLILCYNRSVKEWIADEAAVEMKEVWFELNSFLPWLRAMKGITRAPSEAEAQERAERDAKRKRVEETETHVQQSDDMCPPGRPPPPAPAHLSGQITTSSHELTLNVGIEHTIPKAALINTSDQHPPTTL